MDQRPNSDYGSCSSSLDLVPSSPWNLVKWPSMQFQEKDKRLSNPFSSTLNHSGIKSPSFAELVSNKSVDDVMQEFRNNGSDFPYNPEDDDLYLWKRSSAGLNGMGPSNTYLRQKSWPEPDRTPMPKLPRPNPKWILSPTAEEFVPSASKAKTPEPMIGHINPNIVSAEQARVLNSLPDNVIYALLRRLEYTRDHRGEKRFKECRFCKNNGERESYYRSHKLKDNSGRVTCPVLRAFVCNRCGASGDYAHTIKYCPFSTDTERIKSAAMMRSVRMASARRRNKAANIHMTNDYVLFGERSPFVIQDKNIFVPVIDPVWTALEHKLML